MVTARAFRYWGAAFLLLACQAGGTAGRSSDECSDACARIAAVDCGDVGAECVNACVQSTDASGSARCGAELGSYSNCYWTAESYSCDADRGTLAPNCVKELSAFEACVNGGGGDGNAGGAGPDPDSGGAAGAGGTDAGTDSGGAASADTSAAIGGAGGA